MYIRRPVCNDLFRMLDGIFCIYKPHNFTHEKLSKKLKIMISEGMCLQLKISEFNNFNKGCKLVRTVLEYDDVHDLTKINCVPDIIDNPKVYGIGEVGVHNMISKVENLQWFKTYHITCLLGRASSNGLYSGNTLLRAPWKHVTKHKLDRILVGLHAQHNLNRLIQFNQRLNSQSTYEALASRQSKDSPIIPKSSDNPLNEMDDSMVSLWDRPLPNEIRNPTTTTKGDNNFETIDQNSRTPSVVCLTCLEFKPPMFTLEIGTINENLSFFCDLVSGLGPKLGSATEISSISRTRVGPFLTKHALLLKDVKLSRRWFEMYETFCKLKLENVDRDVSNNSFFVDFRNYLNKTGPEQPKCLFENMGNCLEIYLKNYC